MSVGHVVLLTYGEPPESGFGVQLAYSWRILLGLTRSVAPIPAPLLPVIALSRARLRSRTWRAESYGSPLEAITREQVAGVARALAGRDPGTSWRVHAAYEFRDPLLTDLVDGLPAGERVDVVPMYVADSAFTHALSRATLDRWLRRAFPAGRPAPLRVVPPLDEARLADLSARHVLDALAARGITPDASWALVLAAHGTLLDPPRPIETGRAATERVCAAIGQRLAGRFGMVTGGWLNHVYGGRWTEPPIDRALRGVADAGFRRVAYFPYGFLADNAETELEGRVALRGEPRIEAVQLPCANASPALLEAIADLVLAGGEVRRGVAAAS